MSVTFLALILFALAALAGLFLAAQALRGQSLPMPVSLLHGSLAALGLVLLLVAYFQGVVEVGTALLILVAAALGGFFLFSFHVRGQQAPKAVVVVHALAAVAGVILLLAAVL